MHDGHELKSRLPLSTLHRSNFVANAEVPAPPVVDSDNRIHTLCSGYKKMSRSFSAMANSFPKQFKFERTGDKKPQWRDMQITVCGQVFIFRRCST